MRSNSVKENSRLKLLAERIKVLEADYLYQEVVQIPDDVYNLTIAANMTKNVSPISL